jgi:hypothetical protein
MNSREREVRKIDENLCEGIRSQVEIRMPDLPDAAWDCWTLRRNAQ